MPTYDYICNDCENTYEYFQSMSDTPKKECPDCKKDSLRRVISGGTGLIFKGSGFYLTDYKNNNKKDEKKSDKKSDKNKNKNKKMKKTKNKEGDKPA